MLWLFILFLPTQLSLHFWPDFAFVNGIRIDYLSPTIFFTDFLFLLLIASWLRGSGARKLIFKYKKYIFCITTFAALNILFSQIPPLSIYKWLRIGEGLLLYLYVRKQKNFLNKIKTPLLLSLIFVLILGILQIHNRGSMNGIFYLLGERAFRQSTPGIALANIFGNELLRPYAAFPHPNVLGGYAVVSFFLFSNLKNKTSLYGKIVSILLILVSFSQNTWVAILATPVILFILNKFDIRFFKYLTTSVVSSFLFTIVNEVKNASMEISQRIELNHEAGKIIAKYPLLGVGAGLFITELSIRLLQPVHNIFLLVASEVGIFGLIIFVYFIYKNTNKYNLPGVVAIVLLSMWDHYFLTIHQTSLLFFLVLGYNAANDKNLL